MSSTQSTMPYSMPRRHSIILGLLRVLSDCQPAVLFDAFDAERAVAVDAGEHDRGRVVVMIGERAKEQVDRDSLAAIVVDIG